MIIDFVQIKVLLDSSPIAMLITDPMDKIILCNELACQLLDYTKEELTGKTLKAIAAESPLKIQTNPYQNHFLSTIQKASNFQEKDLSIEDIKERYYALLEGTDTSIVMCSYDGTFRFTNSIAARMIGISPVELIGKKMLDLFPKSIADQQLKNIQHVIQTGKAYIDESQTVLQGNTYWYRTHIQPIRNAAGKITDALISATDITQQKMAEFALQESEDHLQLALKGIGLGWWDSNITTGEIIYNDHWMNLMGFPSGKKIVTTVEIANRIHSEDLPQVLETILQHYKKRPTHSSYEYRFRTGKGEWKWILDLGKVIEWDDAGRAIRAVGICLDITDRVSANKALVEQKRLLEQKNEELEEFSYLSAHDLKSPIVSIVALLEQLHTENMDSHEKENLTQVLLKSARQIQHKVIALNDIITLKKTFNIEPETIDIENSLQQVIALLGVQIANSNADIQFDFSKSKSIYFPALHFERVLQHIITNSIKFQDPNNPPKIHLYTTKTSEYVILAIRDNGIGFDMNRNGDKVFGIFNRFHSKTEGIGVGLYIVHSIMSHYWGKVEIESSIENGTTVTLYFREKHTD